MAKHLILVCLLCCVAGLLLGQKSAERTKEKTPKVQNPVGKAPWSEGKDLRKPKILIEPEEILDESESTFSTGDVQDAPSVTYLDNNDHAWRYAQSIDSLSRLIDAGSQNPLDYEYRAAWKMNLGGSSANEEAFQDANKAIELNPNVLLSYQVKASILNERGEHTKASIILQKLAKRISDIPALQIVLGCYRLGFRMLYLETYLKEKIDVTPNDQESLLALANLHAIGQRYNEAQDYIGKALYHDEQSYKALTMKVLLNFIQNPQVQPSRKVLMELLAIDSTSLTSKFIESIKAGFNDNACSGPINITPELLAHEPNNPLVKHLELYHLSYVDAKKALKHIDEVDRILPYAGVRLYEQLCRALDKGDMVKATEAFKKMLAPGEQPSKSWYQENKGVALMSFKRFDEAAQSFDEAIKLNPQQAWLYQNKSQALMNGSYDLKKTNNQRISQLTQAKEALEKAHKLDSQIPNFYGDMATIQHYLAALISDPKEQKNSYKAIIDANSKIESEVRFQSSHDYDRTAYFCALGWTYQGLAGYENTETNNFESIRYFEKAIKLNTDNHSAIVGLGKSKRYLSWNKKGKEKEKLLEDSRSCFESLLNKKLGEWVEQEAQVGFASFYYDKANNTDNQESKKQLYEKAIEHFGKGNVNINNADDYQGYAWACYSYALNSTDSLIYKNYYIKALAMADTILQKYPDLGDVSRLKGWCLYRIGNKKAAIKEFEGIKNIGPEIKEDVFEGLALSYKYLGNKLTEASDKIVAYKKAIVYFRSINVGMNAPYNYLECAWAYYSLALNSTDSTIWKRNYAISNDIVDSIFNKYPEIEDIQILKGWCLYRLNRVDEALAFAEKMKESPRLKFEKYTLLASCHYSKSQYKKATEFYGKVIEIEPSGEAYVYRARCYSRLWDYKNHLKDCLKAEPFPSHKTSAWLKSEIGWSHYWLKDYKQASLYFQKTLELDKKNGEAKLGLAWIALKDEEDLGKAKALIKEVETIGYDKRSIERIWGYYYAIAEEYDKAEQILKKAIAPDEKYIKGYNTLAYVYELQGKHAEAQKAYEKSLELGGEYYKPEFVIKERNQSMAVTKSGEPIVKPQVSSNTFKKGQRIAFVVNNSYYSMADGYDTLMATQRDAVSIRQAFKNMGYEVIYASDKNRDSLIIELKAFQNKLAKGTYETAVFYYSGHGVRHGDHSYIVPLNAKSGAFPEDLVSFEKIKRDYMAKVKNKIIIADACRVTENGPSLSPPQISLSLPQKGGITSKTTGEDNPENLQNAEVIWYATSQNAYAHTTADKSESIFTKALLKHMSSITNFWTLKASVDTEMNNIIAEEYKKTNGEAYQQTEAKDGKGLLGFYLAPR